MRVTITCEDCGRRHQLERRTFEPGPIWLVCHSCELPLKAVLEPAAITAATPSLPAPVTTSAFEHAWAAVLGFTRGASHQSRRQGPG